jgi:uncharacterized protein
MRMSKVLDDRSGGAWRSAGLWLLLAGAAGALAQDLPQPRNHVEDRAGVIQAGIERQLIAVLADLERKTGAQVIVLTVNTTGGTEIQDYTLALAERWQLGQEGKDNGVLAVIAVKDRKYWITVGYGVESVLPDGFVGTLGRTYFQPYFRQGDYSNGVYQGLLALVQQIARAENVTISGAAAPQAPRGQPGTAQRGYGGRRRVGLFGSCGILPFIVLIVVFSILRNRAGYRRRWGGYGGSGWLTWMLLGSMLGGGRRRYGGWGGGGFGGGFGGGGFGGGSFGGGGGGGFGGGGAGGSW